MIKDGDTVYLDSSEAALVFDQEVQRTEEAMRENEIPGVMKSGCWCISSEDVILLLKECIEDVRAKRNLYKKREGEFRSQIKKVRKASEVFRESNFAAGFYDSVENAAKCLGVTGSHVRRLCRTGKLVGGVKSGKQWRIPKKQIEVLKTASR